MKESSFHYTVLKYRPNYLLDEQINVGLLFVFPKENRAEFLFPKKLQRLKTLFPKSNIELISQYLKSFQRQALRLSDTISIASDKNGTKQSEWISLNEKSLNKMLSDNFIVPDASSFYFSDWKVGEHNNFPALLSYYRDLYFSVFELEETSQLVEA
jgi:Protein of unknown function (DUF3037)